MEAPITPSTASKGPGATQKFLHRFFSAVKPQGSKALHPGNDWHGSKGVEFEKWIFGQKSHRIHGTGMFTYI